MATSSSVLFRGRPLLGSAPVQRFISNKSLTSNLATITTNAVHGITQVGTLVTIDGVDSTFDGTYTIHSVPTTTSFTYAKTATDVASTAVSPVGTATFTAGPVAWTGFTISNKVIQNYVATLTTGSAHGFSAGDLVAVTIGDSAYDSLSIQILSVPSTTTFSYYVSTGTAASTAVTQGTVGKYPYIYKVPSLTTAIATNILINNPTNMVQKFTMLFDNVSIFEESEISGLETISIDLKQVIATDKNIHATASSDVLSFNISGVTIT